MSACQCGKVLCNNSSLKRHERTMHGNEEHICPQCHKIFARRDNLQKHRRTCCRPRAGNSEQRTPSVRPLADEVQDTQVDSPLQPTQASELVATPQADQAATVQYNPEASVVSVHATLGFAIPPEPPIEVVTEVFGLPTGLFKFDFLGRVDCPGFRVLLAEIPSPKFLWEGFHHLQHNYPTANIECKMHYCLVARRTLIPVLKDNHLHEPIDYQLFKPQYVPIIKCLDCPDELFLVSPYQGVGNIEDHLISTSHARFVRLKQIAESQTAREALLLTAAARVITTALKRLAEGEPSIQGLNEDYLGKSRQTLLILSVKNAEIHILRHLLDEGLKVNGTDNFLHRTALHWSCILGRYDIAEILIRYGAKLDKYDRNFETPLDLARSSNGVNTAINLTEIDAKVRAENKPPNTAETPLALACRYGDITVIEAMIANGANVNEGGISPPLEVAVKKASWLIVQILLGAGANVNSVSAVTRSTLMGIAPYDDVVYPDSEEKVSLLKQYGLRL